MMIEDYAVGFHLKVKKGKNRVKVKRIGDQEGI